MKYDIVEGHRIELLVERVNDRLAEGWKPVGGIMDNTRIFRQTIVLEEKKKVTDYVLVTGSDPEDLQKEVNAILLQGWSLHDGPTAYTTETVFDRDTSSKSYGVAQAMVKYG